jgi:triacylglycerol lipase
VTCSRLHAPIVLAHGLFGFTLGLGPWTLVTYFRRIPEYLRAGGNRVLVPQVHPIASVARRARLLGDQIAAAFPDEPVHIIGHSMGGLDARQLLSEPAWRDRVLSLTTIGTPHLGSPLADAARTRLGPVYRLLESLGLDHGGFLDVTCAAAGAWHEATPVPAGVACYSLAGDPALDDVCWPLRALFEAVAETDGPNDGLVSVASAQAFGTTLPATPADHMRQMNWMTSGPRDALGPPVREIYDRVVGNLAGLGFGASTTDTLDSDCVTPPLHSPCPP